ncbi:putative rhamnose biosynthetic enzyme 1 [Hordeum vulgare]|nr:putative rhamnose biosynthetic enzyme 1 [Hordeum vulgare]
MPRVGSRARGDRQSRRRQHHPAKRRGWQGGKEAEEGRGSRRPGHLPGRRPKADPGGGGGRGRGRPAAARGPREFGGGGGRGREGTLGSRLRNILGSLALLPKCSVLGTYLDPASCGSSNFKFVRGDIASADLVNHLLVTESIDTVMHFAPQTHVDSSFSKPFKICLLCLTNHVLLQKTEVKGNIAFLLMYAKTCDGGDCQEGSSVAERERIPDAAAMWTTKARIYRTSGGGRRLGGMVSAGEDDDFLAVALAGYNAKLGS